MTNPSSTSNLANTSAPSEEELHEKAAFDTYIVEAKQLPPPFQTYPGDVRVIVYNLRIGVKAVLERSDEVAQMRGISLEAIKKLPAIGSGLAFASRQVIRIPGASQLATLLPKVTKTRRRLLNVAKGLAEYDLLPKKNVAHIVAGRGKIDLAQDAVDLGALFETHWNEIQNKHPVSQAEIKEAMEDGTKLLAILRPGSVPRDTTKADDLVAALEIRDRFYTLLLKLYDDHLWKAGANLWGRNVDSHVPPLKRRLARGSAMETDEETDTDDTDDTQTTPA